MIVWYAFGQDFEPIDRPYEKWNGFHETRGKSWRDQTAEQYDTICSPHLMEIPEGAQISRGPVTWWKNNGS